MLYKHHKLQLPLYMGMSGIYIILKYTLSPLLYLLKRIGFNSPILRKFDAAVNRAVLPLTERPDNLVRLDVTSKIKKGGPLPPIYIKSQNGSAVLLNEIQTPLMLIFIRGSWCSYSRLHLSDVMSKKEQFDAAGINILVITSYRDEAWWVSKGINIPMYVDSDGEVFKAFGIEASSWIEYAWSRKLPHESAFLFDSHGILIASDIRKVNSIQPGQRFLGSEKWLEIASKNL